MTDTDTTDEAVQGAAPTGAAASTRSPAPADTGTTGDGVTGGEVMLAFATVRTWISSSRPTGLRPVDDTARRLKLIASYSAAVGDDPDTIVERSRGDTRAKNAYLKQLVAWAATLPGSDRSRHDAENLIRGFFMRNGFRVVARPYADVYRRPSSDRPSGGAGEGAG